MINLEKKFSSIRVLRGNSANKEDNLNLFGSFIYKIHPDKVLGAKFNETSFECWKTYVNLFMCQ